MEQTKTAAEWIAENKYHSLNDALKTKLETELQEYEMWLERQEPRVIMRCADEYCIRKSAVSGYWSCGIDDNEALALMKLPNTLDAILDAHRRERFSYADSVKRSVCAFAYGLTLKNAKEEGNE